VKNNPMTIPSFAKSGPSPKERFVHKLVAVALLGIATLSFADAQVPECAPGKLSDYEQMGSTGCSIGDKKFSNFQYHQGAAELPSDAISVTPGTTPVTDDPGLLFEGKWASASRGSFVSYIVEVQPNGKPISGASLQMQFGQITGTGTARVVADLCPVDGAAQSCGPQKLELQVVLSANGSKKPQDNGQFKDPQQQIRVVTPVDVSPGSGGTAELDSFMTVFR
jgi:hypothetical protein